MTDVVDSNMTLADSRAGASMYTDDSGDVVTVADDERRFFMLIESQL